MPAKLDLKKNAKLETVKVYFGKCKTGQSYGRDLEEKHGYVYYLPEKNMKCKITFAKKTIFRHFTISLWIKPSIFQGFPSWKFFRL